MKKEIRILLVEDNEGDIILTLKALKKAHVHNEIDVVRDGEQALQFLHKQGPYSQAETPGLILLDINLPRIDGVEVLSEVKKDERLRLIPVVMLTTSDSEKDIMQSYYHYANCFITKPVNFTKFMEVIKTVKEFWISIVHLPKNQDYEEAK
jgi:two-component system, chemotaxis family, response regulator Rcp1